MNKLLVLLPLVVSGCAWNTNTAVGACRAYRYTLNTCLTEYNASRDDGEPEAELLDRDECDEYIRFGEDLEDILAKDLIDELESLTADGFNCAREIVLEQDCSDGLDVGDALDALGDCDFGD